MHSARIVIVGSGVVGTATGEGFRAFGHRVSFVDISARRVRELRARGLCAGPGIDLADAAFVNLFNATKIGFWNEMWLVAQRAGLELDAVASTVAAAAEGSWNPEYGIRGGAPYGGVCLPKDTRGFVGYADGLGVPMPLLRAVVQTNDRLAAVVDGEADVAAAVPLARASA